MSDKELLGLKLDDEVKEDVYKADDSNEDEPMTPKEILKEVFSLILNLGVAMLCVWLILTFVGQRTVVNGNSMYDTLHDGESLIVEKISYRLRDPQRFEIIVFPCDASGEEQLFIKRIIGLPGEELYIDTDGSIYINGERLYEGYGTEPFTYQGRAATTIKIGQDEYFVLGDNRNHSTDSRYESVGNVKRDIIVGKAWLRIFPFNVWGMVDNID